MLENFELDGDPVSEQSLSDLAGQVRGLPRAPCGQPSGVRGSNEALPYRNALRSARW